MWIGRITIIVALIIAIIVNWKDILDIGGTGGFIFIQKYSGYISPAIFAVFILGFFWKRTTSKAAIAGIIGGVGLMVLFDRYLPGIAGNNTFLYTAYDNGQGIFQIPFLISMGWVFIFTIILMVIISLVDVKGSKEANALVVDSTMFKVSPRILTLIVIILGILLALYIKFW